MNVEDFKNKMEEAAETVEEMVGAGRDGQDKERDERPRRKHSGFVNFIALIVTLPRVWQIIVISVIVASVLVLVGFGGYKLGWFDRLPMVIDKTDNVVLEIKKIGQYTTTCMVEELALKETRIDTTRVAGINVYKENEIVLIGKGRINAGFDLSKLNSDDVRKHRDTLFLTLPPAEIFEIILNPSDYETFYEKGIWSHELTKPLKARGHQQLLEDADKYQILQKAEAYGIQRLADLLKGLGYKEIVVTINHTEFEDKTLKM